MPFYSNDGTDGFSIFLPDPMCVTGSPVTVPSGYHLYIDMRQAMRRTDIGDCLNYVPPSTTFGFYDVNGAHCRGQKLMRYLSDYIGCHPPMEAYVPEQNISCSGDTFMLIKLVVMGELDAFDPTGKLSLLEVPLCKNP